MSASLFVGRVGGLAIGLGIGVAIGGGMAAAAAAPSDSSPSVASAPRPAATGPVAAARAMVANAVVSPRPRITSVALLGPYAGGYAGKVNATGAAPLSYSGASNGKGSVTFSGPNFLFSPTSTASHAAAKNGAPFTVTSALLTLTVSNAIYPYTPASTMVRVPIVGTNAAPVYSGLTATPSQLTGKTTGQVTFTDADATDVLTYSGSATTPKGQFTVTRTGGYTFAPTFDTRHAAALEENPQSTAPVTVVVDDGYSRGRVSKVINIAIAPLNRVPAAENYSAVTTDLQSGDKQVAGTIYGTDPDNDTLTYTITTDTNDCEDGECGQVYGEAEIGSKVGNNGTYTYIYDPAQTLDPVPNSLPTTDFFYVLVNDAHGGTTPKKVTVPITLTP